jgi:hypothetical protein
VKDIVISRRQGLAALGATMGSALLGTSFPGRADATPIIGDEATRYAVIVEIPKSSVNRLRNGGYKLYGLRSVKSSIGGGVPTIWIQTEKIGQVTEITWEERYAIYTSQEVSLSQNTRVRATNFEPASLGQYLEVTELSGNGDIKADEDNPRSLSIDNTTSEEFVGGICTMDQYGKFKPSGAFPIYGNQTATFKPITKVAFFFATDPYVAGTVIARAASQGILVDLTDAPNGERSVEYEINQGWDFQDASWANKIPAKKSLSNLLILK